MTIKRYTHLFFDLDNTLWDFEKNSCSAMQQTFIHFNLQKQKIDFSCFFNTYTKFNRKLWADYRNGDVLKKELTRLRFQQTFEELGIKEVSPDEMNTYYLTEMPGHKCLVGGADELLGYLKSKGYYLYILTNGFREVQIKKLEITGLKKYFKKVFISEDVKAPKPAREIFEYAVKSANAKKSSSIMIGDDQEVDIAGALNYGIDAIWFNPQQRETDQCGKIPCNTGNLVFVVRSLEELKTIF